jgi:hypothetical protein
MAEIGSNIASVAVLQIMILCAPPPVVLDEINNVMGRAG